MNILLDVTRNQCEELLKQCFKAEKLTIKNYQIVPLSDGRTGILGDHWILKIDVENTKKDFTFFIKSVPKMESLKFYTEHVDVFYKEESFYQKIIPEMLKLNINLISDITPICYMIRPSKFLIFQDLSALGYKVYPSINSLSEEAVKLGLETLAKLHAASFIFEETSSQVHGKESRIIDRFGKELEESFYSSAIPSEKLVQSLMKGISTQIDLFPALYKNLDKEKFKDLILNTCKNITELVRPSKRYRNVICHGDVWSGNLMYKENNSKPTNCIIIDLQMYRYCPPAQDLLAFLYMSTDRRFRGKYMQESLNFYYKTLSDVLLLHQINIQNVLSEIDFKNSCHDYEMFAMLQGLSHTHLTKVDATVLKELFDDVEESRRYMFEDRSDAIISFCARYPYYKEMQKESLMNFIDVFLNHNKS